MFVSGDRIKSNSHDYSTFIYIYRQNLDELVTKNFQILKTVVPRQ